MWRWVVEKQTRTADAVGSPVFGRLFGGVFVMNCDRYWFLTWTTYGTWLPGDQRGFVSDIQRGDGTTIRHNVPGTQYDANLPALEAYAASLQKSASVRLSEIQAVLLLDQFLETAEFRQWTLFAVAIMANH